MRRNKNKIKNLLKNVDVIYVVVCIILLMFANAINSFSSFKYLSKYLDIEMLTSVVVAFSLTALATTISQLFAAKFEDSSKLTQDYDALVKKYEANTEMMVYHNSSSANFKLGRKKTFCKGDLNNDLGDTYTIPIGDVLQLYGKDVIIHDDPGKSYTPPEFSQNHYDELIAAHGASSTFNQISLRVDSMKENDDAVHAFFSRTTYFNSLVTNRAIDYKIKGISIRDLYACGPFLPSLDKSPLSNHMGFNGMVETIDGKFVFIKRHKHVSVGKNTMQCSIAASLKAKRALDENGTLTKEKVANAIIKEIEDELNLKYLEQYFNRKNEIFHGFSFHKNVLYFYRDLLEGGKPQLMFYAKIAVHSEELKKAYTGQNNGLQKADNQLYCKTDGYKMLLVDRNELKNIYLSPYEMIIYNRRYSAVPSAVGTVVMLLNAIEEGIV